MNIYKQMMYEYSSISSKPTGFKYDHLKDLIKWNGLKPKAYLPLLTSMFYSFLKGIKS